MKITTEQQAAEVKEYLEHYDACLAFEKSRAHVGSIEENRAALAHFERGAQEREFAKIELSELELAVLRQSCFDGLQIVSAINRLKHLGFAKRDPAQSSFTCDATDTGRAYLSSLDKQAPAPKFAIGDTVSIDGFNRGTIINTREAKVALVKWYGIECESEVQFSELKLIERKF